MNSEDATAFRRLLEDSNTILASALSCTSFLLDVQPLTCVGPLLTSASCPPFYIKTWHVGSFSMMLIAFELHLHPPFRMQWEESGFNSSETPAIPSYKAVPAASGRYPSLGVKSLYGIMVRYFVKMVGGYCQKSAHGHHYEEV